MSPLPRLVLFDIDGTLVDCGGQPRPLLSAAIEAVYGTAGAAPTLDFAGKTDDQIVHEALAAAGLGEEAIESGLPEVKTKYLESLDANLNRRSMRRLPGVEELLDDLCARDDIAIGLLTGNWERGARIKLGRLELDRHFGFGAFGDGCRDRDDLPPIGMRRARESTGSVFQPDETVIVGDTTRDVACGRAHGIRVLAVATGTHDAARLAAAGAEWVVEDLRQAGPALGA